MTVQTLINVKKIKFFLGSSWCYLFPLAIFGLSLDCKWVRDIKSSISDDETMPLFIPGISYLKNMQAISVSKESCSKWANSWRPEKIRRQCCRQKQLASLESLSHPTAHCFDYELCTQSRGQQYYFLSPVSPLEELVLLYKFQLQKVAHTRICSKPIPSLCSQQEFWRCKTAGLELKNSVDFSSCCHEGKAVQ